MLFILSTLLLIMPKEKHRHLSAFKLFIIYKTHLNVFCHLSTFYVYT